MNPVMCEPATAPIRPNIKEIAKAIALTCVGYKSTTTEFITPILVDETNTSPINVFTAPEPATYCAAIPAAELKIKKLTNIFFFPTILIKAPTPM